MATKRRIVLLNLSLVAASAVFALLVAELLVRDTGAGFQNMILKDGRKLVEQHFRGLYAYDSILGWVPAPHVSHEIWAARIKVSTVGDGIRSNGNPGPLKDDVLIMAFGCSFTFGDEVADDQTWPAYLEKLTRERVLNAGVSSYGLDQSVLRAEELVPRYHPDVIIISLLYDAIDRIRESVRHGVPKPYFTVVDGKLVLNNEPVPFKTGVKLDPFRRIFGHSHLVHKLMSRWFPEYWWRDTMRDFRKVDSDPAEIIPLLLERLREETPPTTRIILLVHDNLNVSETRYLVMESFLRQLRSRVPGIEIADLYPTLINMKEKDPQAFAALFPSDVKWGSHYSPRGNALVAAFLYREFFAKSSGGE